MTQGLPAQDLDTSDPYSELELGESPSQSENETIEDRPMTEEEAIGYLDEFAAEEDKPSRLEQLDQEVATIELGGESNFHRRTALSHLYLVKAKIVAQNPARRRFWKKYESYFRERVRRAIGEQSRMQVFLVESTREIPRPSQRGSPGFVEFVMTDQMVQMRLSSAEKFEALLKWSFVFPKRLSRQDFILFTQKMANALIAAIPYKGYITAIRGDRVKINRGRNEGFKKGEIIKLFEFDTNRASFSADKWYLAEAEVTEVHADYSVARIINSKSKVPVFAKVDSSSQSLSSASLLYRNSDHIFLGLGTRVQSIQIEPSSLDAVTRRLQYKAAFSPYPYLKIGYGRFMFEQFTTDFSNGFEQVSIQHYDLSAEAMRWTGKKSTRTLIAGLITEDFAADPLVVDSDNLASIAKQSPYVGFYYQRVPANRTKLYFGSNFYAPVTLSTQVGSGSGFAFDARIGLSIGLFSWMNLQSEMHLRNGAYSLEDGRSFTEEIWATTLSLTGFY